MRTVNIKQKLTEMGVDLDTIVMGDFDYIGEFTAKRTRDPSDTNYKKYGFSYRSNYERGILIYYLIRQYRLTSMLEIGFGRGYATFCAARAFHDSGIDGKVLTIDPALDEKYVNALQQVFPGDWFKYIQFAKGTSQQVLPQLRENNEKFDLVYIDGDHSYEGTKFDWENTKDMCTKFILFDDYHLHTKDDPGIQCRKAIDEINWADCGYSEPELIKMDRRMFQDERASADEQIDYGQCLSSRINMACPDGQNLSRPDW